MTDDDLLASLVEQWERRRASGEDATVEDLCREHPRMLAALIERLKDPAFAPVGPKATIRGDDSSDDVTLTGESRAFDRTEDHFDFLGPAGASGRLGPYRVVRLLGAGGMGAVFEAVDEQLERSVALKTLRPALSHDPVSRLRFLREARAAAALSHDHVVAIYQVGEDGGVPYLAMPLLQGCSLDQRLEREGHLPAREVLRIGREIAEGLAAAHARGLIHRDIKPANVWLEEPRGRVKILDFGLARPSEPGDVRLTGTGAVLGTPSYMAPEQASGEAVDHRCDLYSLGAVLYRMATGRLPFEGKSVHMVLAAVVRDEPVPPSRLAADLPPALCGLIERLMAKSPSSRPASARAVVEAIEAIERDLAAPAAVGLGATWESGPPSKGARRWRGAGVAVALLLMAGAGLVLAQVVIRLKNKDGTVSEFRVAPGTTVEVEDAEKVTIHPPKSVAAPPAEAPKKVAWVLGPSEGSLPGLLTRQARLPGIGRWQVETVAPRRGQALGLSWGARGKIAMAEFAETVRVYDATTLALTRLFHPTGALEDIAWDPSGTDLAVVGRAGCRIYKADGSVVAMDPQASQLTAVAWSPDGSRLATSGNDGAVRIWRPDGTAGPVLRGHEGAVLAVAWAPGGAKLASGGADKTVRVWESDGGSGPVLQGHTGAVQAVAWHPKDGRLASGGDDKTVRIWSAEGTPGPVLEGHGNPVSCVSWNPDGTRLLSGSHDATLRVWMSDGRPGPVLSTLGSPIHAAAWGPDGRRFAASGSSPFLRVWDSDGIPVATLAGSAAFKTNVTWDGDGTRLAVTRHLGPAPGPSLVTLAADGRPGPVFRREGDTISRAAWSPDGARVAAHMQSGPPGIVLFHSDGRPGVTLPGSQGNVNALAWTRDGRRVAAGYDWDRREVRVWSADGTPGPSFAHGTSVYAVAWDASGRLAAGGLDGRIRIWEADGTAGPVLETQSPQVNALAWRPGSEILASADQGCIRFWEAGGRPGKVINIGTEVYSLDWEPNGARLVSGDAGAIRVWSAAGEPLGTMSEPDCFLYAVAWAPVGSRIATLTGTAKLTVWDPDSREPLWSAVHLGDNRVAVFSPAGELLYGDPARIEKELVYAVEAEGGALELLTHSEFLKRVDAGRAAASAGAGPRR